MARLTVPLLACALGIVSALALVSCGGSDKGLLPGTTASEIVKNIDLAEQKLSEQDCGGVKDYAQTISDQVAKLPRSVDKDLRKSLREGAHRLETLADDGCQLATTEPTTDSTTAVTTDEPTTDTTTTTTPTDETTDQTDTGLSTQSTPTTPTTTPTTPSTPTTPTTPPPTTPTTPTSPGGGVGPGTPSGGP